MVKAEESFGQGDSPEGELNTTKNVLVTGSEGFVGVQLCRALRSAGWQVHGLDQGPAPSNGLDLVSYRSLNLSKPFAGSLSVERFDVVVNLAAVLPIGQTEEEAEYKNKLVTTGFVGLLSTIETGHVILFSSSSVYNPSRSTPISSATSISPISGYGRAKSHQENTLQEYCKSKAIRLAVLRPMPIVGAGRGGIFASLKRAVQAGSPIPIVGDRQVIFQVADVQSVVHVALDVIRNRQEGIFGIGNPNPLSLSEYLTNLPADRGKPKLVPVPRRLFKPLIAVAGKARLAGLTPWHSEILLHPHWFDSSINHPGMMVEPECQLVINALFGGRVHD